MGAKIIVHWSHKAGICAVGERMSHQLYDYSARAYNAELRVVDPNGECSIDGIPKYESLEAALEGLTGTPIFLYRNAGGVDLPSFEHPDDAIYIIGPDYEGFSIPDGASVVSIPTPGLPHVELWSQVVVGIILYDRISKGS